MPEPVAVRAMFSRIARRYDLLNRLLSGGIDRRWRSRVVAAAGDVRDVPVVDACCGTGDLSLAFAAEGAHVLGVDFTAEMVALARRKVPAGQSCLFCEGDALRLPVPSGTAAAASVAFGIRNVADRTECLREMLRVVRPGGRVFVLEFSMPPGRVMGAFYRFYFTKVLPRLGGLISGDRAAYTYLPDTVLAWPSPEELLAEMEVVGLVDCTFRRLTFGIACLHAGRAPGAPGGNGGCT